jgi:hypothetical protein
MAPSGKTPTKSKKSPRPTTKSKRGAVKSSTPKRPFDK